LQSAAAFLFFGRFAAEAKCERYTPSSSSSESFSIVNGRLSVVPFAVDSSAVSRVRLGR